MLTATKIVVVHIAVIYIYIFFILHVVIKYNKQFVAEKKMFFFLLTRNYKNVYGKRSKTEFEIFKNKNCWYTHYSAYFNICNKFLKCCKINVKFINSFPGLNLLKTVL